MLFGIHNSSRKNKIHDNNKKNAKNGLKTKLPMHDIIEIGNPHEIKIGREKIDKKSCN